MKRANSLHFLEWSMIFMSSVCRKSLSDENRKVVMDMTGIRMLAYLGYSNDDGGE